MAKVAIQGGVKNYLPSKEVTVPKKAKSSKSHPITELAYITKAEKDLLIKKDLHNSLNGKPNKGPGGIISLNGNFGIGESYGDRQTSDKSSEDVSASRNRTTADKKQRADLLAGKLGYQNDPNNQNRSKSELGKAYTKGAYNSFGFLTKLGMYDKQYKAGLINRQIEKKKNAIRNLINKNRGQNYSPHMDTEEMLEGIIGSYDFNTNTFGKHTFNKGLNKGFDFNINQLNKNMPMTGAFGLSPNKRYGDKGPLRTNYLDTTPDLTSHLSTTPSIMGQILGKVSPMNQNTLKSTLNRINQLDDIALGGVTQSEITDYYDRSQGKGKYDIFDGGDGDSGNNQPYLPFDYNTGAATVETVEPYTNDFTYRGDGIQRVGKDVTDPRGYAADGGIMGTRARRAMGGIMERVDKRQQFFLGGIGKAIGKIGKAAGKVLKSDVGKAAIAAAAIYYGGGGRMPFTDAFKAKGFGGFSLGPSTGGFFSKSNPLLFSANEAGKQVFNPMKFAGITTLAGALAGPAKIDQMPGDDGTRGGRLIDPITGKEAKQAEMRASLDEAIENAEGDPDKIAAIEKAYAFLPPIQELGQYYPYQTYGAANGGRINKAEGGLMNLGGMEKDYRAEGGFVPIGKQEKADDVPARLSVNEFVFTADAVRNAGQGDIDKGAEVMENMMKNLENGGTVSEESQGNTGAQNMFSVSERIGEVI